MLARADGGTRPFVPVCIDGHGPYLFVLDTGASASLVDTQLATALKLPDDGLAPTSQSVGCVTTDRQVLVQRWSVGGVALSGQPLLEADISGFGLAGAPAGVLGGDVLSRFGAISIDYRSSHMTVLAPEGSPAANASILEATTPLPSPPPLLVRGTPRSAVLLTVLKTDRSALATTATAFGGSAKSAFVVDSGSPVSTINSSLARSLELRSNGRRIDSPEVGCEGSVGEVRSGSWSIGAVTQPAQSLASFAPAGGVQNGVAGTVGSNVLSSYGSVVLDYRTGVLWLGTG